MPMHNAYAHGLIVEVAYARVEIDNAHGYNAYAHGSIVETVSDSQDLWYYDPSRQVGRGLPLSSSILSSRNLVHEPCLCVCFLFGSCACFLFVSMTQ